MTEIRQKHGLSVRRLSSAFEEPVSTVGRWVKIRPQGFAERRRRTCPVSGDSEVRFMIRALCQEDRHLTWGYRRIRALCKRRYGLCLNHKTVHRVMREEGLGGPKVWHRPLRPRRVAKVTPTRPCQGWQIDMTSFQLSCLTTLFLVVAIDCFSRRIVGWTLSRRCGWGWNRKGFLQRSCVLDLLCARTTEPSHVRGNLLSIWASAGSRVNTPDMMPRMTMPLLNV